MKKIACVLACNDGKLYQGEAEHLKHVSNDCSQAKLVCVTCNNIEIRETFIDHDCEKKFAERVNTVVKEEIDELKANSAKDHKSIDTN